MALGYLMRKIDILSSEADRSLTRLVVTLLAPCLALDTIIGNDAFAKPSQLDSPASPGLCIHSSWHRHLQVGREALSHSRGRSQEDVRVHHLTPQLRLYSAPALPCAFRPRHDGRALCLLPWRRAGLLEHCACTAYRPLRAGKLAPGNQPSHRRDPDCNPVERIMAICRLRFRWCWGPPSSASITIPLWIGFGLYWIIPGR